eukprot:scaffold2535_cov126-Cylindrotheca_fusiformis.AAC.3
MLRKVISQSIGRGAPSKSLCWRQLQSRDSSTSSRVIDTLIIGGGPVGSSTAYHLSTLRQTGSDIVVLEQDPSYQSSSAMLSAGGIRQHFSLEENVRMSLYGLDFLRNADSLLATPNNPPVDVQLQEHGYLFLASTDKGVMQMKENNQAQKRAGCDTTVLMAPNELKQKFPWLNVSDVLLGSFGTSGEGWFDPWALIQGLKEKSKANGVEYVSGLAISAARDAVSGKVESVTVQDAASRSGDLITYYPNKIVNATGAKADPLMTLLAGAETPLHHPLPIKPRKRCIFFFHCASTDHQEFLVPEIAPLTVDSSKVYFRSEGHKGNFLCGVSPPDDEDVDCWDPDELEFPDYDLFEGTVWPSIAHRVPAFENIKVKSAWAGLYEYNTVDQNAIIDFHPEIPNVLLCNGFSGHGLQHSPATGRAAAELLDHGRFTTLDLGLFSFDRLLPGGSPERQLWPYYASKGVRPKLY